MSEDAACSALGIPVHLHKGDRATDDNFPGEEVLYRRFKSSTPNITQTFDFKEMSVNRAQFCEGPADVLIDHEDGSAYDGFGVVTVSVVDLIGRWDHPQVTGRQFCVEMEHTPYPCNYAHADAVSYKLEGGKKVREKLAQPLKLIARKKLLGLVKIELPTSQAGDCLPHG
jgi:hypothetical protein